MLVLLKAGTDCGTYYCKRVLVLQRVDPQPRSNLRSAYRRARDPRSHERCEAVCIFCKYYPDPKDAISPGVAHGIARKMKLRIKIIHPMPLQETSGDVAEQEFGKLLD